jgi:hypothetical protein
MVKKQVRTETVLTGGPVDHAAGQSYVEDWNTAVFGPGFPPDGQFATRSGDTLTMQLPLFSDAGLDRAGVSAVDSGRTVLYRGSEKVGETTQPGLGQFDVPAASSSYRLEASARRSGVSDLSTQVTCVWTFTSARPPEDDPKGKGKGGTGLPLMAVRFTPPDLDRENTVRADAVRIPVTVQRQAGAPEATLSALTVEVSVDDGRTWQAAATTSDSVTVTHPRGTRFVSLRANATDSAGNTVTQTILRAYRVR